ncbi:MAG TPA: S8 family peptidase [Thermoanaerobaculia bacterium]|nr:S8 family peptidase [Thermoanaerobaculia bacterium]
MRVIVQADEAEAAARAVEAVGGRVTHRLAIIRAVGAQVTPGQLTALGQRREVRRIWPDAEVEVAGAGIDTEYPRLVGADLLHQSGIDGRGVTVALVDTGMAKHENLSLGLTEGPRVLAQYDAIIDRTFRWQDTGFGDANGHGTHVASVLVSRGRLNTLGFHSYNGIAPNARLVVARAFEGDGSGTYSNVIRALDWVVRDRHLYGTRIVNLSFSAPPRSRYWDDPLGQAVMAAWKAGLVVVTAAGNRGPEPLTVGVPGNVPYVVTVGAMTDNYTPDDPHDDSLASFSSAGPTLERFVKPEVVAPGGHMLGLMSPTSHLAEGHPEFYAGTTSYYRMSGTSQSAAVVSGIAALILQVDPSSSPDDVKCRLMAAARPAVDSTGDLAYSVFQQGAGLVNAVAAVFSTASGCANVGLDVAADLAGTEHFRGRAERSADGTYFLRDPLADESGHATPTISDGYTWEGDYSRTTAYLWSEAYLWTEAYLWSEAYLWTEPSESDEDLLWDEASLSTDAYLWSEGLETPIEISVAPEE